MYVIWSNKAVKLEQIYVDAYGSKDLVPKAKRDKLALLLNVANKCWTYEKGKL